MGWPSSLDYEWARQRRRAVKSSGGVLDLLLPLRVTGTAAPIFCVPPVIGLSWCYSCLLGHIDPDHPVYGLQTRGLRRPEPLPADMDEMARDFADQIRRVRPDGPYHLLGWSLGGITVVAVAEELERRGAEIGLVGVLDAFPANPAMGEPDQIWFLYDTVLSDLGYPPLLEENQHEPEARFLEVVRSRSRAALSDWPDERVLALLRVIRNHVTIAAGYRPGRIQAGIQLIAALQTPPETAVKIDRWRPHVGGAIDVIEIDARHEHLMMPEPVVQVGAAISSYVRSGTASTSPR